MRGFNGFGSNLLKRLKCIDIHSTDPLIDYAIYASFQKLCFEGRIGAGPSPDVRFEGYRIDGTKEKVTDL